MKARRLCTLLASVVLVVLLMPGSAAAALLTVTTTDDHDDGACDTDCTLREAIAYSSPGDEISLPAGTYTLGSGLTIAKQLTITGAGARQTTIDGAGADRVLTISAGGGAFDVGISGVTITGGDGASATNSGVGGGVWVDTGATLTLDHSSVVSNSATVSGGGVDVDGTLNLTSSTVAHNTVSGGLGIGGGIDAFGTVNLLNSTVADNTAAARGGGIFNAATLTTTMSTIAGNTSQGTADGGGVANDGSWTTIDTIVAGNSANSDANCSGTGTLTDDGYNLTSDTTCAFSDTGDMQGTDPLLGPLANNGGPTDTMDLDPGSPAFDAGDPDVCPAVGIDQRGVSRPQGAACDIGAYEATTHTLTVTKSGAGSGTVTSSPAGIDCGGTCSAAFADGTTVTLTASPDAGSTFTGWSGGGCEDTGTCQVTIGQDESVTATFDSSGGGGGDGGTAQVTTGSAHAIAGTSATVTGLVNPNGTDASYWFEYGTTTGYGSQTTPDDAGTDNGFVADADLTGLSPGTTYHYRIVAQQGLDTPVHGADRTFTTLGPRLSNITVGSLTVTGATVSVHVDPAGNDTQVHVDYGTDSSYGSSSAATAVPAAGGAQTVQFPLSGLRTGTSYHFRVVATNADGTSKSSDQTLTTTACPGCAPPGISKVAQTQPDSRHDATISAQVDPQGLDTQVHVIYGSDSSYGSSTTSTSVPAVGGPQTVQLHLENLTPAGVYHYKVIATNPDGTADSGDHAFTATCPDCGAPTISQAQAVNVDATAGQATVSALIDPHGFDTSVQATAENETTHIADNTKTTTVPADAGPTVVQFTFGTRVGRYGFQYSAHNVAGSASTPAIGSGQELTFTQFGASCLGFPPPSFPGGAGAPDSVTQSSASVSAPYTPSHVASKVSAYYWEAGAQEDSGLFTPPQSFAPAAGTRTVSLTIGNLKPATTYRYRLVSTGCATVQTGQVQFTTAATSIPKTANVTGSSAGVQLGCATAQTCIGTVTLRLAGSGASIARAAAGKRKPTVLGRARFTIRGHHRATVHVKLTAAGRRALRHHRALRATVRIAFKPHGKKPYTVTDPIKLTSRG